MNNFGVVFSLSKIIQYVSYFFSSPKVWTWPTKSDVLIFDACGQEFLKEQLSDWSVEVLHVRGESINIPVMLFSLLMPGRKSDAYFDVYIKKVRPKLVLTFIDNSLAFYRISSRHLGAKTMFIQNGWRGYYVDIFEHLNTNSELKNTLSVDYMMCFGSAVGRHYQRYISGLVIEMGSLRNNCQIHFPQKNKNTIAYISQWDRKGVHMANRNYSQTEFIGVLDHSILMFLEEYVQEHVKSLYVIPRTKAGSLERAEEKCYFASILGESFRFLEYDEPGSSYRAVDAVDVVVGIDSTLLYESLARGNRTAVFSIRGAMTGVEGFNFGWPENYALDGTFWTNTPLRSRYKEVLDFLLTITDQDWVDELKKISFTDLMIIDPGNSILKKTITQVLTA